MPTSIDIFHSKTLPQAKQPLLNLVTDLEAEDIRKQNWVNGSDRQP